MPRKTPKTKQADYEFEKARQKLRCALSDLLECLTLLADNPLVVTARKRCQVMVGGTARSLNEVEEALRKLRGEVPA